MKKSLAIILAAAIIAVVAAVWYYNYSKINSIPPLTEYGIRFGITKNELTQKVGNPVSILKDDITPNSFYCYSLSLLNKEAMCRFYVNLETDELWRVDVLWETPSENEAQLLLEQLKDDIQDEFRYSLGFHCNEEEHCVTMCINGHPLEWECKITSLGSNVSLVMHSS